MAIIRGLKMRLLTIVAIFVVVIIFLLTFQINTAEAGDCRVEYFNVSSTSVPIGTDIKMEGKGSCSGGVRAVRFTVDGDSKAETSLDNQTEWFRSSEYGEGSHSLCFWVAGGSNGNWEAGAKQCINVTVSGGSSSSSTDSGNASDSSESGDSCQVNYFQLSSTSVPIGTDIKMEGKGSCSGGVRAVRFTVDGDSKAETSLDYQTEWFRSGEYGEGNHTLCFWVAGGSNGNWDAGAKQCQTVKVSVEGSSVNNESNTSNNSSDNANSSSTDSEVITISRNYIEGWTEMLDQDRIYIPSEIDDLRFRSGPGTSYAILGYVKPGNWYILIKESFFWVKIEARNGIMGWVHKDYVRIDHVSFDEPTSQISGLDGCVASQGCIQRRNGTNNRWWADSWYRGTCTNQSDEDWIVTYNTDNQIWQSANRDDIRYMVYPIGIINPSTFGQAQMEDNTPPNIVLCLSGGLSEFAIKKSWVWLLR